MSGGYVPFSLYVDFHAFMSNGMVWAVRSGAVICFVFFFFFFPLGFIACFSYCCWLVLIYIGEAEEHGVHGKLKY